jgi:antitoxin ParD1/3/4
MSVPGAAVGSQRFDALVARLVESGRYNSASEVLEAAVDALEREECDDEAKLAYLKKAIEDGEASGIYEGNPFADIRAKYGLPQRVRD